MFALCTNNLKDECEMSARGGRGATAKMVVELEKAVEAWHCRRVVNLNVN